MICTKFRKLHQHNSSLYLDTYWLTRPKHELYQHLYWLHRTLRETAKLRQKSKLRGRRSEFKLGRIKMRNAHSNAETSRAWRRANKLFDLSIDKQRSIKVLRAAR